MEAIICGWRPAV